MCATLVRWCEELTAQHLVEVEIPPQHAQGRSGRVGSSQRGSQHSASTVMNTRKYRGFGGPLRLGAHVENDARTAGGVLRTMLGRLVVCWGDEKDARAPGSTLPPPPHPLRTTRTRHAHRCPLGGQGTPRTPVSIWWTDPPLGAQAGAATAVSIGWTPASTKRRYTSMGVTTCAASSVASTSAAPSALSAAGASRARRHALNVAWSYLT